MRKLLLFILFAGNAWADKCQNEIPARLEDSFMEKMGKDCLIEDLRNNEEKSCNCIEDLVAPVDTQSSFSKEINTDISNKYLDLPKTALLHLTNEFTSISLEAPPGVLAESITKSCNLEHIKNFQCATGEQLISTKSLGEITEKLKNTIVNNYTVDRPYPDFLNIEQRRRESKCRVSNIIVAKIGHQIEVMQIPIIMELAKNLSNTNSLAGMESLLELFSNTSFAGLSNQEQRFHRQILGSLENSPTLRTFLNDKDAFRTLKNSDPPFKHETAIDLALSSDNTAKTFDKLKKKCDSIGKSIEKIVCINPSTIKPSYRDFKFAIDNNFPSGRSAAANNSELKYFCENKGSDYSSEISTIDDQLPASLKLYRAQNFEATFSQDYNNRFLDRKIAFKSSESASKVQALSLCEYLPQTGRKNFKPKDIDAALRDNCELTPKEIEEGEPGKEFTYPCLQAKVIEKLYGEELKAISALEKQIIAAESSGSLDQKIDINGVLVTIPEAIARRDAMITKTFKEDQVVPPLVQAFIGKEEPVSVAANTNTDSPAQSSSATTPAPTSASGASASNYNTQASSLTANVETSTSTSRPTYNSSNAISQAERDQNTRDLFNEVSRRIQAGNQQSRSNQELSGLSDQISDLRKEVNESSKSKLPPFTRSALEQATRGLPNDLYYTNDNFNESLQYADTATDSNGAPIFSGPPVNDGSAAPKESLASQFNTALGDAAEERAKAAATKSGRSPASLGGGSSLAINGVDIPLIKVNGESSDENPDIIQLAAADSEAASQIVQFIESESQAIVVEFKNYRAILKKVNGNLVVESDPGTSASTGYIRFLDKFRSAVRSRTPEQLKKYLSSLRYESLRQATSYLK